jgi:hypothetical protein
MHSGFRSERSISTSRWRPPPAGWVSLRAATRLLQIVLLLGAFECAGQRAFRPTERVTARSLSGELAAEYELRTAAGEHVGEVKVWSAGTRGERGEDATVLHVGFEIENAGTTVLHLDPKGVFLDGLAMLGEVSGRIAPTRFEGDGRVPPGGVGQLDVYFVLSRIDPTDVDGFQVRWSVESGTFRRTERTPFIPSQLPRRDYPPYWYGPYYGPYWYPYPYPYMYRPGLYHRPTYPRRR